MKVGDLVRYKNLHGHVVAGKFISKKWVGLVTKILVEDLKTASDKHVEVLWNGTVKKTEHKSALEIISTLCNS